MKNIKNKIGFTLVEMLIVIAIIGILMGMLIPSLSKAKVNARRAECASNLRQLYMGSMSYATDDSHVGRFPSARSAEWYSQEFPDFPGQWSPGSAWITWYLWKSHDEGNPGGYGQNPPDELRTYWWGEKGEACITNGTLYSYVRDMRVYICPSFLSYVKANGDAQFKGANRSYVMNAYVSGKTFFTLQSETLEDNDSSGMSRRVLFADGAYEAKTYTVDGIAVKANWGLKDDGAHIITRDGHKQYCYYRGSDGMLEYQYDDDKQIEFIGDWHRGKGNVVFLDGHTECLDPSLTGAICTGEYEQGQD